VIHEVRTPCHQIASNLDVLELEDSNNADNRSVFSSLRFAVQHLSDKMEDVGDILMLGDQVRFYKCDFTCAVSIRVHFR
jgi:hypothetical protein